MFHNWTKVSTQDPEQIEAHGRDPRRHQTQRQAQTQTPPPRGARNDAGATSEPPGRRRVTQHVDASQLPDPGERGATRGPIQPLRRAATRRFGLAIKATSLCRRSKDRLSVNSPSLS